MWFLFKILHVKGRNIYPCKGVVVFHLVKGSAYLLLLVHRSCDHIYIHCNHIHLPLHILFLFYLYTHVSYYLYVIFYFCFTLRCLDEFCLKCLLYSTSEYELSDLWLLSYVHLFVVVLSQIAKGVDC